MQIQLIYIQFVFYYLKLKFSNGFLMTMRQMQSLGKLDFADLLVSGCPHISINFSRHAKDLKLAPTLRNHLH